MSYINLLDSLYPIGSFYFSMDSKSPAEIVGGNWTQIKSKFLLGASEEYLVNETDGEKTHTLTTNELAKHHHYAGKAAWLYYRGKGSAGCAYPENPGGSGSTWGICSDATISSYAMGMAEEGSDQPHNNMPPYLVVYIWYRVS